MSQQLSVDRTGTRILFVCDADAPFAVSAMQQCLRLCDALAAAHTPCVVFRYWPSASAQAEDRHAAKTQDYPYPIFCSRAVRAEAALLALLERPTVAITLGADPVALAQPLLDAGIPCIAWFVDFPGCQVLPVGAIDRRLGLAATSAALAVQLAVVVGKPVNALLPPLARGARLSNQGDAILIPGTRRIDGIQRVFDIARARPQYPFVAITNPTKDHTEQHLLANAPRNVSTMDLGSASAGFRLAVMPTLSADLPWNTLAECLAAGIPILGSTEPLLADAVADAGLTLSVTAPLDAWLEQLDRLMLGDAQHLAMAQVAVARGSLLGLAPPKAAQDCLQLVGQHLASGAPYLSGRL